MEKQKVGWRPLWGLHRDLQFFPLFRNEIQVWVCKVFNSGKAFFVVLSLSINLLLTYIIRTLTKLCAGHLNFWLQFKYYFWFYFFENNTYIILLKSYWFLDGYIIRFIPREKGLHSVEVLSNGKPLGDSPYKIFVGEVLPDANKVICTGSGLSYGRTGVNLFSLLH